MNCIYGSLGRWFLVSFGILMKIAASLLSADFASLGKSVRDAVGFGADYIHIDVMDGIFVPNLTIGSCVVSGLRKYTDAIFDVHLMTVEPSRLVGSFVDAGADIITFHYEAEQHVDRLIKQIKAYGKKVGLALVPSTPEQVLEYVLDELDLVLVMSVNPGFGGQKALFSQLRKIEKIKSMIVNHASHALVEVDGGVNQDNYTQFLDYGADVLVMGSAFFGAPNVSELVGIIKSYGANSHLNSIGNAFAMQVECQEFPLAGYVRSTYDENVPISGHNRSHLSKKYTEAESNLRKFLKKFGDTRFIDQKKCMGSDIADKAGYKNDDGFYIYPNVFMNEVGSKRPKSICRYFQKRGFMVDEGCVSSNIAGLNTKFYFVKSKILD